MSGCPGEQRRGHGGCVNYPRCSGGCMLSSGPQVRAGSHHGASSGGRATRWVGVAVDRSPVATGWVLLEDKV